MAEPDFPQAPPLSDVRVELGLKLLELADQLGLAPEGAAWIYTPDLEEWRYYLVTSAIDVKGPQWVYSRLLLAFRQLPNQSDFLSVDVHLASPKEVLFTILSFYVEAKGPGPNFIEESIVSGEIDGVIYTFPANIVLYRMLQPAPSDAAQKNVRSFDRHVRELTVG